MATVVALLVVGCLGLAAVDPPRGAVSFAEGLPAADQPVPCAPTVRACAALGTRQAWLRDPGGRVVLGPVPLLPGSTRHPTPTGTFSVTRKDLDHVSGISGTPMPFSVFFTDLGHAFHEGSLTTPSAGCIHLEREAARRFFDELQVGDSVQIVP